MKKRNFLHAIALATAALATGSALAQTTPIKFQLDWRFEGPAALFLTPAAKGISRTPSWMSPSTPATAPAAP